MNSPTRPNIPFLTLRRPIRTGILSSTSPLKLNSLRYQSRDGSLPKRLTHYRVGLGMPCPTLRRLIKFGFSVLDA